MKKVLLASTALVAFAGAAAAEVSIAGRAEMGVSGGSIDFTDANGVTTDANIPVQFYNEMDLDFVMTGETDSGLAFGADIDADEFDNLGQNLNNMGFTIFVSGDFGTLTMGDTDGAVDFVTQDMGIGNPGSINDAETTHFGYLGSWLDGSGDGQIVRYDYSFDAFTFAVSVEQMPTGPRGTVLEDDDELTWAVGAGYDFEFGGGSAGVSLGYQFSDQGSIEFGTDDDNSGVSVFIPLNQGEVGVTVVGGSLSLDNGLSAALTYSYFDFDDGDDFTHIGVGAGYSFDAFSFAANYGQYDGDGATIDGWGLSAGYDLGGGASLLAGYGDSSGDTDRDSREINEQIYSFGISMAF